MGSKTGIEWTDHTFNPWIGCTRVSEGCRNCYAESQNVFRKWNGGTWGPGSPRKVTSASNWNQPRIWAKRAHAVAERKKVFCASLADWADAEAPIDARRALWRLIDETHYALDWLMLTKRPERIKQIMAEDNLPQDFFLRMGIWLGTTTENQQTADARIPLLLQTPAAVRFISAEPLLGPVSLRWEHTVLLLRIAEDRHGRHHSSSEVDAGRPHGAANAIRRPLLGVGMGTTQDWIRNIVR